MDTGKSLTCVTVTILVLYSPNLKEILLVIQTFMGCQMTKATGPEEEVQRYREIFGSEGMKDAPVFV